MSKVCVYPFEQYIQYTDKDQILTCKVEGTWDISDLRNIKFNLFNGKYSTTVSITYQKLLTLSLSLFV